MDINKIDEMLVPAKRIGMTKLYGVMGIALGKELHGSLIASNLVRSEKSLESDLIIIRKDTEPFIRSPYDRKSRGRVILIDDVISAGINMLDSLKLLEEAGYIVSGILCVVYRGGGAEKLAEDLNIPFKYLLRIEEEVI